MEAIEKGLEDANQRGKRSGSFPFLLIRQYGAVASQNGTRKRVSLSIFFCVNTMPVASLLEAINER